MLKMLEIAVLIVVVLDFAVALFVARILRNRVRELKGALSDAKVLLDMAWDYKKGCSPWCNGVHEGGCCEGDYHAGRTIDHIEKTLAKHDLTI